MFPAAGLCETDEPYFIRRWMRALKQMEEKFGGAGPLLGQVLTRNSTATSPCRAMTPHLRLSSGSRLREALGWWMDELVAFAIANLSLLHCPLTYAHSPYGYRVPLTAHRSTYRPTLIRAAGTVADTPTT